MPAPATWIEAIFAVLDECPTQGRFHYVDLAGAIAEDSKKEAPTQSIAHTLRLSCGPRAQPLGGRMSSWSGWLVTSEPSVQQPLGPRRSDAAARVRLCGCSGLRPLSRG